jgi:hypothetical protein
MDNRSRTYSMCMNIDGFVRNNRYPRDYNVFEQEDGTPMTPAEARTYLALEKAKGHNVIPCSAECGNPCKHADNGCTGFDFVKGGCPGRYTEPAPERDTRTIDMFAEVK